MSNQITDNIDQKPDRTERSRFALAVIAILALCGVAVLWFAVTDWLPALIKAAGWEG